MAISKIFEETKKHISSFQSQRNMSGDETGVTLEDCFRLSASNNVEWESQSIGTVKRKISDFTCLDNGVSTTFYYKEAVTYNDTSYLGLHIVSYITEDGSGKTEVYGQQAPHRIEGELSDLAESYPASELPKRHEATVKGIKEAHIDMYRRRHQLWVEQHPEEDRVVEEGAEDIPF